ncbi:hypothetical protein Csa_003092 [Cucumis sativus]|uniref:Uncharacterized protein n=1 Tax=Cucumis sativus TaxID=3659 RepID=A0A0A0KE44_CUCSA|nr:hypothetical protein Csa_003092 [Cucumis sativus]
MYCLIRNFILEWVIMMEGGIKAFEKGREEGMTFSISVKEILYIDTEAWGSLRRWQSHVSEVGNYGGFRGGEEAEA